jgi:2'-5' RNA ligase
VAGTQILYFIAIVPPGEVCDLITEIKTEFAERFKSKAALRLIPHITLKAPFRIIEDEHELLVEWFERMDITVSPFHQELENYGSFRNRGSGVIFVKPVKNVSLDGLQKQVVQNFTRAYPGEPINRTEFEFTPHVTIAYRDLPIYVFKKAWKEYRDKRFRAAFEADSFDLLQRDGKTWKTIRKFFLPSVQ